MSSPDPSIQRAARFPCNVGSCVDTFLNREELLIHAVAHMKSVVRRMTRDEIDFMDRNARGLLAESLDINQLDSSANENSLQLSTGEHHQPNHRERGRGARVPAGTSNQKMRSPPPSSPDVPTFESLSSPAHSVDLPDIPQSPSLDSMVTNAIRHSTLRLSPSPPHHDTSLGTSHYPNLSQSSDESLDMVESQLTEGSTNEVDTDASVSEGKSHHHSRHASNEPSLNPLRHLSRASSRDVIHHTPAKRSAHTPSAAPSVALSQRRSMIQVRRPRPVDDRGNVIPSPNTPTPDNNDDRVAATMTPSRSLAARNERDDPSTPEQLRRNGRPTDAAVHTPKQVAPSPASSLGIRYSQLYTQAPYRSQSQDTPT